ncbi:MAG: DUF362 domain-containing protein [Anaerolineales bacterium]|nr:DUF362 domain-containing protein [Anaerolineales bacterium]
MTDILCYLDTRGGVGKYENQSIVSLVRSEDHYEGELQSLEPFRQRMQIALSDIDSLVLKINLVITRTPRYSEGVELATTPLEAVRGFLDFIQPFYNGRVIIAEEPAWGDTSDGFEFYGFAKLAAGYPQVELLDLREDEVVTRKVIHPDGELELPLSRAMVEAPFLVSITRPKTHCSVVMTAGIKNVLVGAIHGYGNRRKIHPERLIHYMIASLAESVYPDFALVDGTVGMEGGGPVRGTAIDAGWVVSSFDALAVDTLAAHLMGFDVEDVGYLTLLGEKQVGEVYPSDRIEVLGEKPADLFSPFKPHRNFKEKRKWKV